LVVGQAGLHISYGMGVGSYLLTQQINVTAKLFYQA
jgi:hypothetical protein